jgi:hypothetical protein
LGINGDRKMAEEYIVWLRNDIKSQELVKRAKEVNLHDHNQLLNHAILKNARVVETLQQQEWVFLNGALGSQ